MRIFYAAADSPNPHVRSTLWRDNLYQSLVTMGNEVIEFDYDMSGAFQRLFTPATPETSESLAKLRASLGEALLEQITKAHRESPIQLFFSYFYDACVEPAVIDAINDLGIMTVNWYCNGSYQLDLVREISPHYTWCLVPEKNRIADYTAMGARPLYCQEAANPHVYKPLDLTPEWDVTFVGQAYGERPALIKQLSDNAIDVRVWGPAWEYHIDWPSRNPIRQVMNRLKKSDDRIVFPKKMIGGVLTDRQLVETYNRSRINLGFATCGETHLAERRISQIRLRDFEVPMSGGFYLAEYSEELEEFFEVGSEIACHHGMEDIADKVRYYLAHDAERERIRAAGHARSLRDHTWQRRFEMAFDQMGLASALA
jgi:spore maturation protein CgeB